MTAVDDALAVMRRWAPYDGEQDAAYDADLDALVTAIREEAAVPAPATPSSRGGVT